MRRKARLNGLIALGVLLAATITSRVQTGKGEWPAYGADRPRRSIRLSIKADRSGGLGDRIAGWDDGRTDDVHDERQAVHRRRRVVGERAVRTGRFGSSLIAWKAESVERPQAEDTTRRKRGGERRDVFQRGGRQARRGFLGKVLRALS